MYYKVCAKCGHVGRNKFIHKWLYIEASNKKEAAEKAKKEQKNAESETVEQKA